MYSKEFINAMSSAGIKKYGAGFVKPHIHDIPEEEIKKILANKIAESIMDLIEVEKIHDYDQGETLYKAEFYPVPATKQFENLIINYNHLVKQNRFDEQIWEYQYKQAFRYESPDPFKNFMEKIDGYHREQHEILLNKNEKIVPMEPLDDEEKTD